MQTRAAGLDELKSVAHQQMREYGLEPEFSAAALRQVEGIAGTGVRTAGDVRDLRQLLWSSIDNDDSRDLDQLSVAEPLPGGAAKIFVAIADVDAHVQQDSPIDKHACTNTTSVYTAAKIFPMLPEKLSTDLTSLVEGQDRLAMVCEVVVTGDGAIEGSDIYRGLVRNHAKLAYNSVAAWLDGKGGAPARLSAVAGLDEQLRIQDRVAQSLRDVRYKRGALRLETSEARPVFDQGILSDIRRDEKNRAKELIEDFMIVVNEVVARFLMSRNLPVLRRMLGEPTRWPRIVALAAERGEILPPAPDARALNSFLRTLREKDPARFPDVSLSIVKLLGSGEYRVQLPGTPGGGHFGLAARDYTHSTAPNRRFPDLITQRLVKAALTSGAAPYTDDELTTLAAHCTKQEDNAAKVERVVSKSAAALLLRSRVGQRFEGLVTGASPKGTWVRITAPVAEGKLVRGAEGLDVGDHVSVELVGTDVERGFIDFAR